MSTECYEHYGADVDVEDFPDIYAGGFPEYVPPPYDVVPEIEWDYWVEPQAEYWERAGLATHLSHKKLRRMSVIEVPPRVRIVFHVIHGVVDSPTLGERLLEKFNETLEAAGRTGRVELMSREEAMPYLQNGGLGNFIDGPPEDDLTQKTFFFRVLHPEMEKFDKVTYDELANVDYYEGRYWFEF
jgi:hypothetical protein